MNAHFERAQILIHQNRFDLAERELRGSMAESPDDYHSHALLAFCLLRQGKSAEGLTEARAAVGKEPGAPYAHYILALAYLESGKRAEAQASAREAIHLDPEEPDYFALLGAVYLEERNWPEALANAEKALTLDAEHVQAANVRAAALVKLRRGAEAGLTLGTALAREPDSAITHANMGWTLLEGGDHKKALEHFREALRLNPNQEWAREGIVEAMKARNIIYRTMLRYFFFMSKLSRRNQWGVILIALLGTRMLRYLADTNPALEPVALVLGGLYLLFMAATWMARPLFDLVLRLDRFGRLCLSEDQIKGSNWLGAALLGALVLLVLGLTTKNADFIFASVGCMALCLPLSGIYQTAKPGKRRFRALYTAALALIGVGVFALPGDTSALSGLFLVGVIAYTWIANF